MMEIALSDPYMGPRSQRRVEKKRGQAGRFHLAVQARILGYRFAVEDMVRVAVNQRPHQDIVHIRVPRYDNPIEYVETFVPRLQFVMYRGDLVDTIATRMARQAVLGDMKQYEDL